MLELVSMQWDVRSAANLRMPRVTSDIMNIANASVHRRDSESRNTPPACAARQHEPGMATGCYWNSHKIPAHAVKLQSEGTPQQLAFRIVRRLAGLPPTNDSALGKTPKALVRKAAAKPKLRLGSEGFWVKVLVRPAASFLSLKLGGASRLRQKTPRRAAGRGGKAGRGRRVAAPKLRMPKPDLGPSKAKLRAFLVNFLSDADAAKEEFDLMTDEAIRNLRELAAVEMRKQLTARRRKKPRTLCSFPRFLEVSHPPAKEAINMAAFLTGTSAQAQKAEPRPKRLGLVSQAGMSTISPRHFDDEVDDVTVGLQVQQFLDEWHFRVLHSGLAYAWDRPEALIKAMDIFEASGMHITQDAWSSGFRDLSAWQLKCGAQSPNEQEEKEQLANLDEEWMIEGLVQRMPGAMKKTIEHFLLQLQLVLSTATRVRNALEEGSPDEVAKIMDDGDTGITQQVLKEVVTEAGREVGELQGIHQSWDTSMALRIARLIRCSEEADQAALDLEQAPRIRGAFQRVL
eukprot:s4505_g2.t1